MGMSTDGKISYGVLFEEDYMFPWGDQNIEDWWIYQVLEFKHSFEIYNSAGEYIDGIAPPETKIRKWYSEKRDFAQRNPKLPVVLVNYCSGDYPSYILAIPGTVKTANRGNPVLLSDEDLKVSEDKTLALREFIQKYNLTPSDKEGWYLSSYLG